MEVVICDHCGAEVTCKGHLDLHMRTVHDGKGLTFACDVCSKEFSWRTVLLRHIKRQHRIFECQLCPSDFGTAAALKQHHAVTHNGTKVQCDTCGKVFGQKEQLVMHIASVHLHRKLFKCDFCGYNFTLRGNLTKHIAVLHHQKRPECDQCGANFGDKKTITAHIHRNHMKLPLFACCRCEAEFVTKSCLSSHVRAVHEKQPSNAHLESSVCDQCGEKFKHKENLVRHTVTVHAGVLLTTVTCDLCSKEFVTKADLSQHVRRAHQQHHPLHVVNCQLCGCDFPTKKRLLYHQTTVHDDIKFQCDTCGKLCGGKHNLSLHITGVHRKERPFECVLCGAKFPQPSYLRSHTVKMHGRMWLQCDDCGSAKFAHEAVLAYHLQVVHLKLRVFNCGQCQAIFRVYSDLIRHRKNIHNPKEIAAECDACGKSFTRKANIALHLFASNRLKCSLSSK